MAKGRKATMGHTMRVILLILTFCSAALTANAQTIGIQFDKIPVGSQFHYETVKGSTAWIEIYRGKKGAYHEMHSHWTGRNHEPKKLFRITYYNDAGLMVRMKKLTFDALVTFQPFNCTRSAAATCTHIRYYKTNDKAPSSYAKDFEARRSGKQLLVIANATSNRLKTRYTFDERGILIRQKNISTSLTKGHRLVREAKPK